PIDTSIPPQDSEVVVPGQALQPGVNCMAVTVDDQLTAPLSAAYVITRRTATSTPTITDPPGPSVAWSSADDADADPANGFQHTIEVTLDPTTDLPGVLTLREVGGATVATQPVAPGTTVVTLPDVTLPPGTYDL